MKKIFLSVFATLLLANICQAQALNGTVSQDSKINNLIDQKRKLNSKITINDLYKIQIYHGNSEGAKKALNDFSTQYTDIDATIIYVAPNYKVWVGSYKSKIEANRALNDIKKYFDRSLIVKPNK